MMNIEIEQGVLYVDNLKFCLARLTDGCQDVRLEPREIRTQFSHNHGKVFLIADGIGWVGGTKDCAIVVGDVRGRDGAVPCLVTAQRLVERVESAEDIGCPVLIEIK